MRHFSVPLAVIALLSAPTAFADRTQVYSLQGADCADCADRVRSALKKRAGIKDVSFDRRTVEITVKMTDAVGDDVVLAGIAEASLKGAVGGGHGAWALVPDYPPGADVQFLTRSGAAVGPLEKLRVPGKFTVFDVYADWCGPCRQVDARLREISSARQDVAIRKLDVVDFDSPLGRQLGAELESLPYVVVFSPAGKRSTMAGPDLEKLDRLLDR